MTLQKAYNCAWMIVKLVVPFSLVCDLLKYFGIIENIAFLFSPISKALFLPPEVALAIASGFFFNLYAGIAVAATLDLNSFQWTTFGIFLATCHSIPIETAVLKKVGMPVIWHWTVRLLSAFNAAWLFSRLADSTASSYLSSNRPLAAIDNTPFLFYLLSSFYSTFILSLKIIVLVISLIFLFEWLKKIPYIAKFLLSRPYLSSLIVGILLGITYGAGILLTEIKNVNPLQKMLVLVFLMLAHGLIEETLLFTFFGATPIPIISSRLGFALLGVVLTYLFLKRSALLSKVRY